MKKENQIPLKKRTEAYWGRYAFVGVMVFLFLVGFIAFAKAETKDSPSMNIFTFSNTGTCEGDTTLPWWDNWRDWATLSASAGELYFGQCDSNGIYYYYNHSHALERGTQMADLKAWWLAKGHVECDSIYIHWRRNTIQVFDISPIVYTFRPGWNPAVNDTNGDFHRDYDADYDFNHNQANFSVQRTSSPYYITDDSGGKSGVSWTANRWQGAAVKISTGTDADTTRLTCDSSTTSRVYLSGIPPASPTWYVISKGGDINAVAMADSQARVGMYSYCDSGETNCENAYSDFTMNSPCVNFGLTDVQNFMGHDNAEILRVWRAVYAWLIGIHEDNVFIDWREDKIHSQEVGVGGGMENILEENINSQAEYVTAERDCNQHQHDSVHTVSGRVSIEGNIGDYKTSESPLYMTAVRPCDGILQEGWMDIEANLATMSACKSAIDNMHDSSMQVYLMMKNTGWANESESYQRERFLRGAGVYYCLLGHENAQSPTANFLFLFNVQYGPTTCDYPFEWWMPYAKFNMGYATGICSTYTSGGYTSYYRRYDNGIALLYPRQGGSLNVPLGGTYYEVLYDGTLSGTPVTSYTMSDVTYPTATGGMGRLFGKPSAPDSLDQYISEKETTMTSFTIRDSISNLWGVPTDSVRFLVRTYNSWESLTYRNHLINVDTGNLSATSLIANTYYYYGLIAFEGSHRDSSAIAQIRTEQAPDSLSQVTSKVDTDSIYFKIRDVITTLYSSTADTVILRIGTSSSIGSSSPKDTFYNDNDDTLLASGLNKATKYYFWCIARDDGHADTTSLDSVTTDLGGNPPGEQGSITYQDGVSPTAGYTGCVDAGMLQQYPTSAELNNDDIMYLQTGSGVMRRYLVRFDLLDSIASTSTVDSAYIQLKLDLSYGGDTLRAYGLKNSRAFSEGSTDDYDCCWNRYGSGSAWSTYGCDGVFDRDLTEQDKYGWTGSPGDGNYRFYITSLAQEWVVGTREQNGIILIADGLASGYWYAYASEWSTASQRPKLVIYYTTVGTTAPKRWLIRK